MTDKPDSNAAHKAGLAALTLGAIGVVYGDIGTSPLYTVKEVFGENTGVPLNPENLTGAISVIFWALMLVVTLKYVILILKADNNGEGGGLALTALASEAVRANPQLKRALLLIGVFGATLFYGDSVITPAISVLGAMEGLTLITPTLTPYIIPLSVVILIGLFAVQRLGTSVVGRYFGPIIVLWFLVLGGVGILNIVAAPEILHALNPLHGIQFVMERGWALFAAFGAIVLALTGAEALYADMGHFGKKPIRLAWTFLVFPCLALNYLGQGALLIADPSAIENPFYRSFPETWVIPALCLATMAAIIASQAVISGAYSMSKQAIQLGFLPRMKIHYTSAKESGQIYMPAVNWLLLAGVLLAVLLFKTSSNLAGAYGIAVTLTMLITTILTYFVIRRSWGLPAWLSVSATCFFVLIDLVLVISCALKLMDGGWFPILLGLVLFTVMATWWSGRKLLMQSIQKEGIDIADFLPTLNVNEINKAERTAVYPVADPSKVPMALLHNLKHNQVLHARNLILTVVFDSVPWVGTKDRVEIKPLGQDFWQVTVRYGFMNTPNIPHALSLTEDMGLKVSLFETTYFLSRETVVPTPGSGMVRWREQLFAAMSRNAGGVVDFFRLPSNAVVELGTRVQI
ncbi:KUP system potassium uptake protein [Limnobacter thiooxidans]|uniref:Probable potassium transport system protein Kup n=1 Tax=Limnobacter thiooxidans TaxID=131080 RepID=A0AA86JK13_9BURK|nr:potassium transporter Kup [Limnobacter sp.]MCZ8015599.1 potassium transporter Kup [Limnobacter sp.]RZS42683.1 KUP system potassium uptake protein [Limnobacter thiooxidans]BET25882.1 potassium transporter Kup [Limnobacter thiooxidans]